MRILSVGLFEQEQQGQERAKYGSKIIDSLSAYLTKEYGRGFSRSNVAGMRQFYMAYKDKSSIGQFGQRSEIIQSGIGQLDMTYARLPLVGYILRIGKLIEMLSKYYNL